MNSALSLHSVDVVSPEDWNACWHILREGSRSFAFAARALPVDMRRDAAALYAFCRQADDLIDAQGASIGAIAVLEQRLDRMYAQTLDDNCDPVDRALAQVIARFQLPRTVFSALLQGFAWDLQERRYADIDELKQYCLRVASTVGVLMTLLMRQRDPFVLARACDLGVAMQLTNIARDVGEDARAGRVYLPAAWLLDEGIDPAAFLRSPVYTPALGRVVKRLLDEAAMHYRRAELGMAFLPKRFRVAIHAAALIYEDIGHVLKRRRHDSIAHRAVTSGRRKLWLMLRASRALWWSNTPLLAASSFDDRFCAFLCCPDPHTTSFSSGGCVIAAPPFDRVVPHDGYAWWYIDGVSDCGRYGITAIFFIGSVFSPYYAKARRRGPADPLQFCAVNAVLYARRKHWVLTEWPLHQRDANRLVLGPNTLTIDDDTVTVQIRDRCVPWGTRSIGLLQLKPIGAGGVACTLDDAGRHFWQPVAPLARIAVEWEKPRVSFTGTGYFDANWGSEPLERAFRSWVWSRTSTPDSTRIVYDVEPRCGEPCRRVWCFAAGSSAEQLQQSTSLDAVHATASPLSRGFWGMEPCVSLMPGETLHSARMLEDAPFYTRSLLHTVVDGVAQHGVHESVSLDRFVSSWVQPMLYFKTLRLPLSRCFVR